MFYSVLIVLGQESADGQIGSGDIKFKWDAVARRNQDWWVRKVVLDSIEGLLMLRFPYELGCPWSLRRGEKGWTFPAAFDMKRRRKLIRPSSCCNSFLVVGGEAVITACALSFGISMPL